MVIEGGQSIVGREPEFDLLRRRRAGRVEDLRAGFAKSLEDSVVGNRPVEGEQRLSVVFMDLTPSTERCSRTDRSNEFHPAS